MSDTTTRRNRRPILALAALPLLLPSIIAAEYSPTPALTRATAQPKNAIMILLAEAKANPKNLGQIVGAAVVTLPDQAIDLVREFLVAFPAEFAAIVKAAILALPEMAGAITEVAMATLPDQAAEIQEAALSVAPEEFRDDVAGAPLPVRPGPVTSRGFPVQPVQPGQRDVRSPSS